MTNDLFVLRKQGFRLLSSRDPFCQTIEAIETWQPFNSPRDSAVEVFKASGTPEQSRQHVVCFVLSFCSLPYR
jgi:hypothetical protein